MYKTDGKTMLHHKPLPKDSYKVSVDKSLVDAACIPDVGSNGLTTVKDAVIGFYAWLITRKLYMFLGVFYASYSA